MVPTSRLDDDIAQRPAKRPETSIASTILARVPDEVLSIVFSRFVLVDVVPLMRVCTRWRAVVLEHHSYCSLLHLPADAPLGHLDFVLRQANRAIERTGTRSVDIDVDAVAFGTEDATRLVRALAGCVARAARMKVVVGVEAFETTAELLLRKAPLLVELEFGAKRASGQTADVDVAWRDPGRLQAPNLRSLTLIGVSVPTYSGPTLPSIKHLRLEKSWDGPVNTVSLRALSHVFPSLVTLTLSGNIRVEPLEAPSKPLVSPAIYPDDLEIALRRLTLDTLESGTQWPALQPHLRRTQTLEINSVTQEGVRAIVDHLRPPYTMSVFMATPLDRSSSPAYSTGAHLSSADSVDEDSACIRFAAHGACGRTFAVLFGGTHLGDYYSHLPVNPQTLVSVGETPRIDIALLAPQVTKVDLEIDLWEVPCETVVEYGMLEEMKLVWTASPISREDGCETSWSGQMIMPLGGKGIFSFCPALRVLTLENAVRGRVPRAFKKRPWVDADEVEDFARLSLVGLDFRHLKLQLLGLDLKRRGVDVVRDTIFGEVTIIPGSV